MATIRVISNSFLLSLLFTYSALSSEKSLLWILRTKHSRFRTTIWVKWHTFGPMRVFTRYSLFYFCLFNVAYHHSKRQKFLRLDQIWALYGIIVKYSLLPFLDTYIDLSTSKMSENFWTDSKKFGFWGVFLKGGFHLLFFFWWAYSVQSFKRLMKGRGKSLIIILAIEILLCHHSSVCTAKP